MSRGFPNDWVVLPLLLAVVAISAVVRHWRLSRSKQWPVANGRIERCEAATLHVGKTVVPGVRLYYSFKVNNEYCGGQIAEIGFSQDSQIEEFIRKFGAGTPVIVRYDPKNIDSSTISLEDNPYLNDGISTLTTVPNVDERGPDFTDLKI